MASIEIDDLSNRPNSNRTITQEKLVCQQQTIQSYIFFDDYFASYFSSKYCRNTPSTPA